MKIGGAIAGDGGEPARKLGDLAERGEVREGLEKNVLDEVVDVRVVDAGKQDAVDHAGVAGVEETECGAIALLSGANEGVVGAIVIGGSVHGRETGGERAEFEGRRHVVSIEMKKLLLG